MPQADGNRNKPLFTLFLVQRLDDIVDKAGLSCPAVSRNQVGSAVRPIRPQPVAELLVSAGRVNVLGVGLLFGSSAVEKLEVFHQDVDAVAARRMKPVELIGSFGIGFHGRAKVIKIRLRMENGINLMISFGSVSVFLSLPPTYRIGIG